MQLFAETALLPDGMAANVLVEVADGMITSIAPGARPPVDAERVAVLVPAVGNLHSHAFQRAMSGLAEQSVDGRDNFWSWRDTMYRLALQMTPDDVEAVAAQLYVEMLEAGFSRVGEFHYLHHDRDGARYGNRAEMAERIAAASVEAGIGLTLLPVLYRHSGFGPRPPTAEQRRFITSVDDYAGLVAATRAISGVPDMRVGIAPHSLRAATIEDMRLVLPLAEGGPVHIHVAEQMREVNECLGETGARPVELLLANLPVDRRWCLIHATHLVDAEVDGIARSGAVAGLCPVTEANLGDGIFRGRQFIDAGGRYGVGSDSNVLVSLAGELRQLEYSQRLQAQARNVLAEQGGSTGATLLRRAAEGGTAAIGGSSGISVGQPADLLGLAPRREACLPLDRWLDAFVFGQDVVVGDVWVGGRKLVTAGRHANRDAIRRRFDATMRSLAA